MNSRDEFSPTPRRRFLKQTIFGSAALFAGGTMRWLLPEAVEEKVPTGLKYFSSTEFALVRAIERRIVGEKGENGIDVAERADAFLSTADPEIQSQLHQLFAVFNNPLFAFIFDFQPSSFLAMTPGAQDAYLHDWMTSRLGFRRTGFQALKRLTLSMYYTDERSWTEIGFDGQFIPQGG